MNLKIALGGLLVVGFALPAAADSYYLTQDSMTKKCTVTREKPTTTSITVIDGKVYTSQTEAEGAMKTTKICTTE